MRGLLLKLLFSLMLSVLILGTVLTALIWYIFNDRLGEQGGKESKEQFTILERHETPSAVGPQGPLHPAQKSPGSDASAICKDCKDSVIDKVVERYYHTWKRQEENLTKFRSLLSDRCHGPTKAIVTQDNTPLGTKMAYDGEKKKPLQVTAAIFSTFAKEHPFLNKTWDTCAVVGNGGILTNSNCGEEIDSAQFVIRCNLPPLENGYEADVGYKTDVVTANPSILLEKFAGLMERRRPFVESVRKYGDALMVLPAFSYVYNTPVCLRALYTIQDFDSPARPVFFNPEYLQNLAHFWRGQGLMAVRLSTGLMMASLALEVCANVHLYGFWPFNQHPFGHRPLTNHYYDNKLAKKTVHAMPAEFDHLLSLHDRGILRLHLGECLPAGR